MRGDRRGEFKQTNISIEGNMSRHGVGEHRGNSLQQDLLLEQWAAPLENIVTTHIPTCHDSPRGTPGCLCIPSQNMFLLSPTGGIMIHKETLFNLKAVGKVTAIPCWNVDVMKCFNSCFEMMSSSVKQCQSLRV